MIRRRINVICSVSFEAIRNTSVISGVSGYHRVEWFEAVRKTRLKAGWINKRYFPNSIVSFPVPANPVTLRFTIFSKQLDGLQSSYNFLPLDGFQRRREINLYTTIISLEVVQACADTMETLSISGTCAWARFCYGGNMRCTTCGNVGIGYLVERATIHENIQGADCHVLVTCDLRT